MNGEWEFKDYFYFTIVALILCLAGWQLIDIGIWFFSHIIVNIGWK